MGLDLAQLLRQVEGLGREAAQRASRHGVKLERAREAFAHASTLDLADLRDRIDRAGPRWRGARPTDEPLDLDLAPPSHPPRLTLIGADGSQIYPDRHAAAHYYLLNIGSLTLVHGSGKPPRAHSLPILYYQEDDLFDRQQAPVDQALVNARRDVAEIEELARQSEALRGGPALALLDNALLLWLALQEGEHRSREVEKVLGQYVAAMQRVRASGAALAGFVDRPGSVNVLALAHLAALNPQSLTSEAIEANPFRGLADRELFAGRLAPGHRSARFESTSPLNRDLGAQGHGIHFFYLNTGYQDQIARVEIPTWVAEDPDRLSRVHSGIVEQCRITGLPYVLIRAHELAVVTEADRRRLEAMLEAALLRHGIPPRISQKRRTKQWTGAQRRHRL